MCKRQCGNQSEAAFKPLTDEVKGSEGHPPAAVRCSSGHPCILVFGWTLFCPYNQLYTVSVLTDEGQFFSAELHCCEVTNVMLSVVFVLRLICVDQSLNV